MGLGTIGGEMAPRALCALDTAVATAAGEVIGMMGLLTRAVVIIIAPVVRAIGLWISMAIITANGAKAIGKFDLKDHLGNGGQLL